MLVKSSGSGGCVLGLPHLSWRNLDKLLNLRALVTSFVCESEMSQYMSHAPESA